MHLPVQTDRRASPGRPQPRREGAGKKAAEP